MALYADVQDPTLQKLILAVAQSIRQGNGSILTEYKDRYGKDVPTSVPTDKVASLGSAREFDLRVKINPDGASATAWVTVQSPRGPQTIKGTVDISVLATKLA